MGTNAASPPPVGTEQVDSLAVRVYADRQTMGQAAARQAADHVRRLQRERARVRIVFASAPSQDEMLASLAAEPGIDWSRVVALHMDEYLGLPGSAPQSFGSYLATHLFSRVRPEAVHYIDGMSEPALEAERYGRLLQDGGVDLCCMGIGENGHIAFNEPPVADFEDRDLVKVVDLDEASRLQQVHDGCFAALAEVPRQALTLTVPALMAAAHVVCTVPGERKRPAVERTLRGPVGTNCPATALRSHRDAVLFLDTAAWPGRAG